VSASDEAGVPIADDFAAGEDPRVDEELRELRPVIEMLDRAGARMRDVVARAAGPEPEGSPGDFTIVRVIGRGGMGVVYEAVQQSLRRRVALKVLPPAFADDPRRV
jgi:serine/threonine protein kinase